MKRSKRRSCGAQPYGEWLASNMMTLKDLDVPTAEQVQTEHRDTEPLLIRQQAFGYTLEDIRIILHPMATNGEQPLGSMGTDTPLAVLSQSAASALQLL